MARKLAKTTLDRFRKRLEDEKTRLEEQVEDYQRVLEEARLTESSSDRSPDPGNAEASSMKLEYAKELSIEQNTLDLLSKVDRALERVAAGTYGICESCGNSIPVERLDVLPYSTLCVECAARTS
ncbi:MAG TPA: TraR/DksA C4-type zinc finger protein [Acidimicrobiia bacterium]|nr:TraR/DksA C4-type zinc finger protein [Acidimicrobiia bacterium]